MANSNQFEDSWRRVKALTGWGKNKELADFLEISGSSVSGTKGRGNFPLEWAHKIAKEYNGSTDWILEGRGPMHIEDGHLSRNDSDKSINKIGEMPQPKPCMVDANGHITIPRWNSPDPEMFDYVPMAEAQLSAGGGCFVLSENFEGYYAFRKNWLSRVATSAKNLVLMRVQGNSMSPTIQDGDTVMIDTGRLSIKEGMLYALRFDETIMIKRLSFRPEGRVSIISDNRHEHDAYEAEIKSINIIGQVIFFSRSFIHE